MAVIVAAWFVVPPAFAADALQPQPGAIACDGVQQDRAACLREAGAARQERKADGLTSPAAGEEQSNALARCAEQSASARAECEARVRGTGNTTSQGSVLGGGIIRQTTTPVPPQR